MPDVAQSLAERIRSRGENRRAYSGLRTAITAVAVVAGFTVIVLWCHSYVCRDGLFVQVAGRGYCRIDSDRGRVKYESFRHKFKQATFVAYASSHADTAASWRSFTDAPLPGPGKHWRWEKSSAGRFFVHVPHWFVVGIAIAVAVAPWLPWRFSLRTLLVSLAVISLSLGFLVWLNAPPRPANLHRQADLSELARTESTNSIGTEISEQEDSHELPHFDFSELADSLDDAIGPRLGAMDAYGTESVSYQYNGPIDDVLKIVAPIAADAGFSEETADTGISADDLLKEVMEGGVLEPVGHKLYLRGSGELLSVSRMAVGKSGGVFVTISYMDPRRLQYRDENTDNRR